MSPISLLLNLSGFILKFLSLVFTSITAKTVGHCTFLSSNRHCFLFTFNAIISMTLIKYFVDLATLMSYHKTETKSWGMWVFRRDEKDRIVIHVYLFSCKMLTVNYKLLPFTYALAYPDGSLILCCHPFRWTSPVTPLKEAFLHLFRTWSQSSLHSND